MFTSITLGYRGEAEKLKNAGSKGVRFWKIYTFNNDTLVSPFYDRPVLIDEDYFVSANRPLPSFKNRGYTGESIDDGAIHVFQTRVSATTAYSLYQRVVLPVKGYYEDFIRANTRDCAFRKVQINKAALDKVLGW